MLAPGHLGRAKHRQHVVATLVELVQVALHPRLAAVVAETDDERQKVHRRRKIGAQDIDIAGEASSWVGDYERYSYRLIIETASLTGHETVGAGVVPMIGREHNNSVLSDLLWQCRDDLANA